MQYPLINIISLPSTFLHKNVEVLWGKNPSLVIPGKEGFKLKTHLDDLIS